MRRLENVPPAFTSMQITVVVPRGKSNLTGTAHWSGGAGPCCSLLFSNAPSSE